MTAMVLTAADIARRCGGRVEGDAEARADSWAFDSRALDDGACFVALRGARDGHDFVPAAFDAGAHVAIVSRHLQSRPVLTGGRALVHVDDTLRALQDVGRSVRTERSDARVVAIAGSTGKTSTKDLLAATLAPLGCHANAESYNNEFGLPITLCNTPGSARVVVTEMGERFPGDLALLCDIARPHVAALTNVGLAHAEHLGGLEGVAAVLGELMRALPGDGVAVLNADDRWTPQLAAGTRANVVTVGFAAAARYRIGEVELDGELRPSFRLCGARLRVPLHGAHHVMNAALAATVAHHVFGLAFDDIAVALAGASTGKWRMELLETDDAVTILNDAYNANPTSMEAALVALAHLPVPGRRVAVLGDMLELGAHHDEAHRAVGARAAALGVDLIIGVGRGGAVIAQTAQARGASVEMVGRVGGPRRRRCESCSRWRGVVQGEPGGRARSCCRRLARAAARWRRWGGRAVIAMLMAAGAAFLVTIFGTPLLIRWLRANGIGQQIRDDGPIEHPHVAKAGTPTMGGIALVVATVIGYVFAHVRHKSVAFSTSGWTLLALIVGLGAVGFLDDYLGVRPAGTSACASAARRSASSSSRWRSRGSPSTSCTPTTHLSFTRPLSTNLGTAGWFVFAA